MAKCGGGAKKGGNQQWLNVAELKKVVKKVVNVKVAN